MTVGAVDIGTNSMRVLIIDDTGSTVERRVEVTGLGTGLDATGRLQSDAMDRTVAVLEGFGQSLRTCDSVRVVATSASREAENGSEFIDRAAAALGHRPEVISGEEEARLAYDGALASLEPPAGATPVVVDIGGGSTEFVQPDTQVSCRIGSVRLTDRALSERPVPFDRLEATAADVSAAMTIEPDEDRSYWMVGVAGTWTSLVGLNPAADMWSERFMERPCLEPMSIVSWFGWRRSHSKTPNTCRVSSRRVRGSSWAGRSSPERRSDASVSRSNGVGIRSPRRRRQIPTMTGSLRRCPGGAIGRRGRLKISCPQGHVGSNPTPGTSTDMRRRCADGAAPTRRRPRSADG